MESIDWSDCSLVEIKLGAQGGSPLLRGTRLPVAAIVDNFAYGVAVTEISEQFEVPIESVHAIVTYAESQRVSHRVATSWKGSWLGVWRAGAPSGQPDFVGTALTSTAGVGETSEEAGSQWCGYSNSEC